MAEREELTWELFGSASRELARTIADSGYEPDLILSIARGGLFVAGALGYALDVKNLHAMNVEYYTGATLKLVVQRAGRVMDSVAELARSPSDRAVTVARRSRASEAAS